MDNAELVCWNCLERSRPGKCKNCGVELSAPDEVFAEEDKIPSRAFGIPRRDRENTDVNLNRIVPMVKDFFEVQQHGRFKTQLFVLNHPGEELEQKYEYLKARADTSFSGRVSMLEDETSNGTIQLRYMYPSDAEVSSHDISNQVEEYFSINDVMYGSFTGIIIDHPDDDLDGKLKTMMEESKKVFPWINLKVEKDTYSDSVILQFIYQDMFKIELDTITDTIEESFEIVKKKYGDVPEFVLKLPEQDLDDKFDQLLEASEKILPGFTPMLDKHKAPDKLKLSYIYREPFQPTEYRTSFLLAVFTILSIFLAGLFSGSQLEAAINGENVNVGDIFNFSFNFQVVEYMLFFSVILILLLMVKDSYQLRYLLKPSKQPLTLYYIPAPPLFELGTFGSVYHQDKYHKTRQKMFNSTFFGPIVAWLLSVITIFLSLPLSTYNPGVADSYANHSITANGQLEPIIISVLSHLSNFVGLTDLDLSAPFTSLYVLHPITAGALGAFYIISFALFPVAHLNGGFIVRSVYGKRAHLIFTYLTIVAIYFVNWIIAIFIFFIHELLKTPEVLNEKSNLNKSSKWLMIPFFLILALSYPFDLFIIDWLF